MLRDNGARPQGMGHAIEHQPATIGLRILDCTIIFTEIDTCSCLISPAAVDEIFALLSNIGNRGAPLKCGFASLDACG